LSLSNSGRERVRVSFGWSAMIDEYDRRIE